MRNPWLDILEADYVGHMMDPAVNQAPVLARLLQEALAEARPASLLVLGCATGNGFEHIDPAVTRRVVGLDINPRYLRSLAGRHPNPGFRRELLCADLGRHVFRPDEFDLVHAALVFEYVEWPEVLPRVAGALRPGGMLDVVLQRPSPKVPAVTPTGYASLAGLESIFRFVDPDAFAALGQAAGLHPAMRRTVPLVAGKAFEVVRLSRATG